MNTNRVRNFECVRPGCGHSSQDHLESTDDGPGQCMIHGCKCKGLAFLSPRYFMPEGETDPIKGHFGCIPMSVVPESADPTPRRDASPFPPQPPNIPADLAIISHSPLSKDEAENVAYIEHMIVSGSRGGGKTARQQALTENGKRILREGIESLAAKHDDYKRFFEGTWVVSDEEQAEVVYEAWMADSVENEAAEKHEAFVAGYLAAAVRHQAIDEMQPAVVTSDAGVVEGIFTSYEAALKWAKQHQMNERNIRGGVAFHDVQFPSEAVSK